MNCSEFNDLLDLYIDEEIDDIQRKRFEEHAAQCADCGAQLRAARQLQDILSHMDEDVAVPLPAQAAWRSAIRHEARKRRMKRIYSAAGAVAAACVLTIGVSAMIGGGNSPEADSSVVLTSDMARKVAYVESDGVSESAMLDASAEPVMLAAEAIPEPYAERMIMVEDVQSARDYLQDIVAEYDGLVEREAGNAEKTEIYVRVPGENMPDFVSAVDHLGSEVSGIAAGVNASEESVGMCIVIVKEK